MSGTLYVCGTPIGNLKDVSLRCLEILQEVDLICAEDTRQTLKLLSHYNIKKKLVSYHEHNKFQKGQALVNELIEGKNIAIVTDAGMPGISDPGEDLIKLCYNNRVPVTSVPGPTAVITAIVLSGLSTKRYCFEGFLSQNKKERALILEELKMETRTICFYEAPHRLIETLKLLYATLGNRKVAIVKELTKKYEFILRDDLNNVIDYFLNNSPKGEFVIVVEGLSRDKILLDRQQSFSEISIEDHLKSYENQGFDRKAAMKLVANDRGISKRDVYSFLLVDK